MEIHFTPEIEERITQIAGTTGRDADELVRDVMAEYLAGITEIRATLDRRYDEIKSGDVESIDGEEFFEALRKREDNLLASRQQR